MLRFFARVAATHLCWILVVSMMLPALGCQHQQLARLRLDARQSQIRQIAQLVERTEVGKCAQLAETTRIIESNIHRNCVQTAENPGEILEYLSQDWQRWHDRSTDYYGQMLYEAGKGNPGNLEPVAISLFY